MSTADEYLNRIETCLNDWRRFYLGGSAPLAHGEALESLTALRQHCAEMERKANAGNPASPPAPSSEAAKRESDDRIAGVVASMEDLRRKMEGEYYSGFESLFRTWSEHLACNITALKSPSLSRAPTLPNPQSPGGEAKTSNGLSGVEADFRETKWRDQEQVFLRSMATYEARLATLTTERDRLLEERYNWRIGVENLEATLAAKFEEVDRLTTERDQARARSEALLRRKREMLTRIDVLESALRKIDECGSQLTWPDIWEITKATLCSTEAPPETGNPGEDSGVGDDRARLYAYDKDQPGSPVHPPRSEERSANREWDAVRERCRKWLTSADETSAACGSRPVLSDSLQLKVTSLSITVGDLRALVALPIRASNQEDALATKGLPDIAGAGTEEPQ